MENNRKNIYNVLLEMQNLKNKYERAEKDISRHAGRSAYEQTIKHYDELIVKLMDEVLSLPIGYRYTGTFYIKKAYTYPTVFEKYDGVIYMREDLISWQIEKGPEPPILGYHRTVFKQPSEDAEIFGREDAVPVYAINAERPWSELL